MHDTVKEFDQVTAKCRAIFINKMSDYGPSWRIFRLHGITDQLYIKACNIRQRQETGVSLVGDDIPGNLRAIVNYGITAIIQSRQGFADAVDMTNEEATKHYDAVLNEPNAETIAAIEESRRGEYAGIIDTSSFEAFKQSMGL